MSRVTLVRTGMEPLGESAMGAVRNFLFGVLDGFSRDDKKGWRKVWKRLNSLDPGEMAVVEIVLPRSGPFHRRHMKIEASVFDAQERFDDFEMFRDWLKIGAGWVVWAAGPKGGVVPLPKSISYAKADQYEFEQFHRAVMAFLRGQHAARYLWPHLSAEKQAEMIETILTGFGE